MKSQNASLNLLLFNSNPSKQPYFFIKGYPHFATNFKKVPVFSPSLMARILSSNGYPHCFQPTCIRLPTTNDHTSRMPNSASNTEFDNESPFRPITTNRNPLITFVVTIPTVCLLCPQISQPYNATGNSTFSNTRIRILLGMWGSTKKECIAFLCLFTLSRRSSIISLQSSVLVNSKPMYISRSTHGSTSLFK